MIGVCVLNDDVKWVKKKFESYHVRMGGTLFCGPNPVSN